MDSDAGAARRRAALLDRRPWLAACCIGLLAYKPQFGVLIPVALPGGPDGGTPSRRAATVAALWLSAS